MKFIGNNLEKMTAGAAGYDLTVVAEKDENNLVTTLYTDTYVEIPDGYVGLLTLRSSMSGKVILLNGVGIIDSDYRGELKLKVNKIIDEPLVGKRVAQLVVVKLYDGIPVRVKTLTDTDRGQGGFGSTKE